MPLGRAKHKASAVMPWHIRGLLFNSFINIAGPSREPASQDSGDVKAVTVPSGWAKHKASAVISWHS